MTYSGDSAVALTLQPGSGMIFIGWSDPCPGSLDLHCEFTVGNKDMGISAGKAPASSVPPPPNYTYTSIPGTLPVGLTASCYKADQACPANCASCSRSSYSCDFETECSMIARTSAQVMPCPYPGTNMGVRQCGSNPARSSRICHVQGTPAVAQCVSCPANRYGPACEGVCPSCQNGGYCNGAGTTGGTGGCTCRPGSAGDVCLYTNAGTCSGHGTVDANGTCTCSGGFSGTNCSTAL